MQNESKIFEEDIDYYLYYLIVVILVAIVAYNGYILGEHMFMLWISTP